ncbi:MAG TPA: ComEC/Rec2 family competence protein, partial [Parvularculaceae bacterium]|nr:ComEC/Rec2 family competence protein [Parvularculaceae bacterium]
MAARDIPLGRARTRGEERWEAFRAALSRAHALALANLRQWSAAETDRFALWAPALIGAGVVLYFSLKAEPSLWFGAAMILSAGVLWRMAPARRRWASAALFIALGFFAAELRAHVVAAPILQKAMRPTEIVGRLISVDEAAKSRSLIIDVAAIKGLAPAATPKRVRLSWRGKDFDVLPGETITLRGALSPPPAPATPGGFDFARQLYFERIGAVGYAVSAPKVVDAPKHVGSGLAATIEKARLSLSRRILEKAPGAGGAIVAAVVTGKRGAVDEASQDALRDSGLAHLLAISGLHMGLATGLIFFMLRFALALIEPIALRHPIKKWAAGAALLSGFGYLLLSGGGWSAQRAFIMSAIIFIAILFDRRALSLRNVAVAATIILLASPEAVMQPGFQMSFAAVTALIAAYEWAGARADPYRSFAWPARIRRYFIGVLATDAVAAAATAPFSLYHFHRAAAFGLAANVVAIPLMGFWVMPAAVIALLLAPFGLDGFAWRLSAEGVEAILAVARFVASRPGSVVTIADWPPLALGVLTLGGLWLCIQRQPWRWAGLAALPVVIVMAAFSSPAALYIAGDGL